MRHALFVVPLLLCLLAGGAAVADDAPFEKGVKATKKDAVKAALKRRVSVTLERASVADAVDDIAQITGLNVVLDADVESTITLKLIDVSAGSALHAIADAASLEVKISKDGVIQLRGKSDKQHKMRLFDARDLFEEDVDFVKRVRRARPRLVVERKSDVDGIFVVRGTEEDLEHAAQLLEELRREHGALERKSKDEYRALKAALKQLRESVVDHEGAIRVARDRGDMAAVREHAQELEALARRRAEMMDQLKGRRAAPPRAPKAPKAPKASKAPRPPKAPHGPKLKDRAEDRYREAVKKSLLRKGHWDELTKYAGRRNDTEGMERLEHLRLAHRSLAAAGMHAEAERVERELHELERHLHRGHEGEHGGDVMHELRALREEVHGLRAEVQMLTALVKKLLPKREARRAPR